MMLATQDEFDAILRTDPIAFTEKCFDEINGSEVYLDNFHVSAIWSDLLAMQQGDLQRLAIALPPRSLKSIIVSVAYVAWLLGHDPSLKIICASYGQHLSDKLAFMCRKVMQSSWYKRLFPGTRFVSSRPALGDLVTTAGGYRLATSVGGSVTGQGADYFIIDDASKPEEALSDAERNRINEWGRHTLLTRLNQKLTARIIIVMQRLHEDDLFGHISNLIPMKKLVFPAIAQEDEHYFMKLPYGLRYHCRREGEALHPEREPLELLELYRAALGEQFFCAQYLQMPAPPGGSLVKRTWFPRFDPTQSFKFDEIIQSWDTAQKASERSDYSVCTTWGRIEKKFFLLHVLRKRFDYPDLKRAVISQDKLFTPSTIVIEDAGTGSSLLQEFAKENFYKAKGATPKGDKFVRLEAHTAIMEAGMVYLPTEAAWLAELLHELTMFPAARYDDQVDSFSQGLAWMSKAGGPDAWLAMMDEHYKETQRLNGSQPPAIHCEEVPVSGVRVNHPNKELTFFLQLGRNAEREADGSFLVDEEDLPYLMVVQGLIIVSR